MGRIYIAQHGCGGTRRCYRGEQRFVREGCELPAMGDIGKLLVGVGAVMILVGLVMLFAGKLGVGKLPGDFVIRRGNFTFYFPLMTSLLLSAILSLVFWLLRR